MKGTMPNPAHVPIRKLRMEPAYPDQLSHAKPAPAPEASAPNSDSAPESSDVPEEGIY